MSTISRIVFSASLLLCACEPEPAINPNFDFSSMDHFWEVVRILEADLYPFPEVWDSLFATPGYAALTESEFSQEFFKKHFQTAFMPSKALMLEQKLKEGTDLYLRHYNRVKYMRNVLKAQQRWLAAAPMMREARRAVRQYLPARLLRNYPPPPIAFLIFANDTRSYSPLIVDLLYSLDQEEHLSLRIGHEAHHYYRNKLLTFDPGRVQPRDRDVIWVLNQIQAEGLADRVDRRVLYFQKGYLENMPEAQYFKALVARAPAALDSLNILLNLMADRRRNYADLGRRMRALLPMDGHAVGYYMTSIILKRFGNQELVERVGNPFAFFRLYHLAAIMPESTSPKFSSKAVAFITELEKRYSF